MREPPSQACECSPRRKGRDKAGVVQKLQVARCQQVLADKIEIYRFKWMPTNAEIEACVGWHGLIQEPSNVVHRSVELCLMWKIELRPQLELMPRIVARREQSGRALAARIEM